MFVNGQVQRQKHRAWLKISRIYNLDSPASGLVWGYLVFISALNFKPRHQ